MRQYSELLHIPQTMWQSNFVEKWVSFIQILWIYLPIWESVGIVRCPKGYKKDMGLDIRIME
jgi:hypothetical protein